MAQLTRSRTDRRIAGICGGIAHQNGWDPTIVRVVWLACILFAGTGVLIYLILWVVLPQEPLSLPPLAGYPVPPAATYPSPAGPPYGPPQPPPGHDGTPRA